MQHAERLPAALIDEGQYRLLVEAVSDYAIFMLDPDGFVASWNPGARRFKGYETAEILGHHFSCFYTAEDLLTGLPGRALEQARCEGRFEQEGWRVRKDGTRFWAHVVIDPIRNAQGTLLGFAKVTRDLTERKAAEDALRKSEEQFRLLVQGVSDYALYMLDPNGQVTSWNAGAEKIKGYTPQEIIGQHFSRFYTPEDREAGLPQQGLETAQREGRFEKEGWRIRKDGTRFWANVVIDAIRDDNGTLLGYAKVTRDITEKRETQLALEQAREALFQSQKMEALGQLTGGIAHDFNNLLMVFIGCLELVRKRLPDDPKVTPLLDNAIQGAQRGVSLTQRMLAFARRQELNPETIELPTLVRGMAELLQRSLGPSIKIETRFPLILKPAHADTNQLELALLNLAMNARDAMPEGGSIIISARDELISQGHPSHLKPGAYVCLSVQDTGQGMDEDTLSRAMEPFFTTKGIGKGTGLGLSMVHGLTEQSGGRLILKSRLGEGTTAEIWLPAAHVSDAGMQTTDEPLPAPSTDKPENTFHILVVDDDPLVLTSTAAMLEDLGNTVYKASSGAQALDILRKAYPLVDLVITDQAMPYMSGTQLAEAIRAHWADLPIVLASGYAELPATLSVDLHKLAKPFRLEELAKAIDQAMRPDAIASA
ncbi:PAS domain S-box protein [Pseudomonas luteola]|uniref:hybrid sensor histidine kinase/response regulator n=1 Tax=Pseudomonas luteola TaxID=47886 RepID=UPI003DA15576